MPKKLIPLSDTLSNLLKSRGLESRLSEYRILGRWEKAVGKVIAEHARPRAIRGKKLFLTVDSPAWMHQLALLKPEIIEKVNRTLKKETVKDIVLTLGDIGFQERRAEKGPSFPPLEESDHEKIETCLKEIPDADVRAAVRRVMEKDFLTRKKTLAE